MELMKDLHPLGVTWSSKRLDNIHIHLFMPERFGLQAAHRRSDPPFGVLVEVQAARKLVAMYGIIVAA